MLIELRSCNVITLTLLGHLRTMDKISVDLREVVIYDSIKAISIMLKYQL